VPVSHAATLKKKMRQREILSRHDIDQRAEALALHFDHAAFDHLRSPLYLVVKALAEIHRLPFLFRQDLGSRTVGKKILGRFDFDPSRILIDQTLSEDSPRFRWTLCHEIGHYVLHRHLDPSRIGDDRPLIDTRDELFFIRTAAKTDRQWIEWQANKFAAALLLPRPILKRALIAAQDKLDMPKPGSIYVDDQPRNLRDFETVIRQLSAQLGASKTMIRIRLIDLKLLTDARPQARDLLQGTLRELVLNAMPT
jgi:Zn-dependent peptidase ImmA (M78 family)